MNKVHTFRDRDLKRIVKAARAVGIDPTAVEVDTKTGKIKIFSSDRKADGDVNYFDQEAERLRHKTTEAPSGG